MASFGFEFDWLREFCETTGADMAPLEKAGREATVWLYVQSACVRYGGEWIEEAKREGLTKADIEAHLRRFVRRQLGLETDERSISARANASQETP